MNTKWRLLTMACWLLGGTAVQAAILQGPITNPANGHTYYLLTANSWTGAQTEAQTLGGNLVTINDAAENDWILTTCGQFFTSSFQLWIGLTDQAVEGQFVWTSGEPVTYTNWAPGEPNNVASGTGEDYAHMVGTNYNGLPSGSWNDATDAASGFGTQNGVVEVQTPPAVVTVIASGITAQAATLNGTVNPLGVACTARFEYGLTTAYGSTVNVTLAPNNGSVAQSVSASISGLQAATTYHFRMSATNAQRTNTGADMTFTTQSTNANLAGLALGSGKLFPAFSSAITGYTTITTATSIAVKPTLADLNAAVRVNGIVVNAGSFSGAIPLTFGPNLVSTVVIAQNGITTKTYSVNVIRVSADLASLATSAGALAPSFGSTTTEYTACVANPTTSITIKPTVADVTASVRVNGIPVNSGSDSGAIQLAVGSNVISVVVSAQDATTTKTYHVTVTRLGANPGLPNEVVAWGAGMTNTNVEPEYGQLIAPAGLSGVTTSVAAGLYHTVALKNDGTVVAWGRNTSGQTTVPGGLSGVIAIATGAWHTLALKDDGTVVAWGAGKTTVAGTVNLGQSIIPAGLTTLTVSASVPDNTTGLLNTITLGAANSGIVAGMSVSGPGFTVGSGAKVVSVAGTTVTLSVPNANTVFTPAQLTFSTGVVAIAAGYSHNVALKGDGTVVAWGDNTEGQTTSQAGLGGVVAIAAGNAHTVALKRDGTVVAWGRNVEGQTTLQSGLYGVAAIAAGGDFTMALRNDGSVVAWGDNANGQATVPTAALSGVTAIAAGGDHAVALKHDHSVVTWGKIWNGSQYLTETVPAGLGGVSAIAAGAFHAVAVAAAPLAITSQPASVTVNQGGTATFTVAATSTVPLSYQWRKNNVYLADGGDISGAATASLALANVQWSDVSNYSVVVSNAYGGVTSAAAILTVKAVTPGAVVAWGAGTTNTGVAPEYGQSLIPAGLAGMTKAVAGGTYHTVALKEDGTVVAWGNNSYGQTTVPSGLRGVTAIAAGAWHTLALKNDGSVVAWGAGTTTVAGTVNAGQSIIPPGLTTLAVGATVPANTTGLVNTVTLGASNSGIVPGMTVSGPGFTVGIGAKVASIAGTTVTLTVPNVNTVLTPAALTFATGVVAIAAGYFHNVALGGDGSVVAWGDNSYGQVTGTPTTTSPYTAIANPVTVVSGITAITAGSDQSVALKNDGTVVAWGRNAALSSGWSGVTAIAAGESHTLALKSDGTVVALGDNFNGQTNVPAGLSGVTAIAAGGDHAMALKSDGTVVTWGKIWNGSAYLTDIIPAGLSGVTAIAAGAFHTVAMVASPAIIIGAQPVSRTNVIGTTATFIVTATGTPPLSYQWRRNGANLSNDGNISGTGTATLALANVQPADASDYSVVVADAYGSVTSTSATLAVIAGPLSSAVDSPGLEWTTGGDAPWFAQTSITHDGVEAASSGAIGDGKECWLQTTLIGPGTLSYWWKVYSENTWDVLEFDLDGVPQSDPISGETGWQQRILRIPVGPHTVKWRYAKDESYHSGQDAGWVDEVAYVADIPVIPQIATQPVSRANIIGTTAAFAVAVTPTSPATCQWRRNEINLTDGGNIAGANTTTLTISNIQLTDIGNYTVVVTNAYGSTTSTAASLTLATPLVATGVASGLTKTSAILNGTVNPNGLATSARFEYGLTTAYGSKVRVTLSPDDGLGTQNVSITLGGLLPGTTYHYRLTATSNGGTSPGGDMTFQTQSVPITAKELVAPGLAIIGGNLNFTINPSVPGRSYQLQQSDTMAPGTWMDLGALRSGDGNTLVIITPCDPAARRRIYRIALRE
ncbi:MAG: immunoglobulin domain-containing protein [Verrucomicrobia bacterium]|nr:immunoglobulin domain-containing protein [Verrucomicrobiota bacterium]